LTDLQYKEILAAMSSDKKFADFFTCLVEVNTPQLNDGKNEWLYVQFIQWNALWFKVKLLFEFDSLLILNGN
jgi:hypothetical protein